MAQVDILPGWTMENGHRMAAIRVSLAPGWHTYWRAPGEAGIPPSFNLSASQNLSAMSMHWPTPELHSENGMWYLGYENELILPIELAPTGPGEIHLSGDMEFGVCKDICIPMTARIDAMLSLPGGEPEIRAALKDRPKPLQNTRCTAQPVSDGMQITATLDLADADVAVIEHPDKTIWISEAMVTQSGGQIEVTSDLVPIDSNPFMVDRSTLVITAISDGAVYEAKGCSGS